MSKGSGIGAEVAVATGEIVLRSATDALVAEAPESGLIELCRLGDARAFARLVALHERMVFNLATRLLGDAEEAKDLSQETFLQVYRTIHRFEGRSSLKTWIYRIVVNQCHNRQRWWKRRRKDQSRPIDDLTAGEEAQLSSPPGAGPFEDLARREQARRVQAGLNAISFDQRSILILREVEGLSCEEIATALTLPIGTVKSRLARGREALRQQLAKETSV